MENEAVKRCLGGIAWIGVVCVLAGCNTLGRQPQLQQAMIAPPQLKPGDSAVVSVHVQDKHYLVRRVEGFVREEPSIKFKLKDDGVAPDAKAGDNIWTLQVDVPFTAPAGDFTLELTAYRADGTPVPVRDKSGKTGLLTVAIPVIIRNP